MGSVCLPPPSLSLSLSLSLSVSLSLGACRCSPQIGYFYCDCRYFRPGRIDSQVNRVEFFRAPSIPGSNKTLKEKKSRKYKQFSLEHKVFLLQCSKFTGKIFKT